MCLTRPAQLLEVTGERGVARLAPLPGEVERELELDLRLTPEVGVGSWVLVHAGVALEPIEPDDAHALIELLVALAADSAAPITLGGTP